MFINSPQKDDFYGDDANYFTIHYSLRKLIGEDLLSRRIFVNHTINQNIVTEGGYFILQEKNVVYEPWTIDKFYKFSNYLTWRSEFNLSRLNYYLQYIPYIKIPHG